MSERPMVNVYEIDEDGDEVLVYREMNDEEHAQWVRDQRAAADQPDPEHPLLVQVKAMSDDERTQLNDLLKGAP